MSILSLERPAVTPRQPLDEPGSVRRAQLEAVSEQFEALFLQQILKQMRKAGDVLSAGSPTRSRELDTLRDFYDEAMAETLAGRKQTGIADMLVRQLGGGLPGEGGGPDEAAQAARALPASLAPQPGLWQRGGEALSGAWARGSASFKALVDSLIKHESSGDAAAVSAKGARGLMQLMPDTARDMAAELGLAYDEQRLLSDPAYNKRLGSAYLDRMLARYDGHQALALAAYNAGPGRVDEWLQRNGDPRRGEIGVADWVERIPYRETRDYTRSILRDLGAQRPASPVLPEQAVRGAAAADAARAMRQGELLGLPAGPVVSTTEDGGFNPRADRVALQQGRPVSAAFAQPIRIDTKESKA